MHISIFWRKYKIIVWLTAYNCNCKAGLCWLGGLPNIEVQCVTIQDRSEFSNFQETALRIRLSSSKIWRTYFIPNWQLQTTFFCLSFPYQLIWQCHILAHLYIYIINKLLLTKCMHLFRKKCVKTYLLI